MKLIVDANVVVSAIIGRGDRVRKALAAGIDLFIPAAQSAEVEKVLSRKFAVVPETATRLVEETLGGVAMIEMTVLELAREAALERLGPRGQPDWPVLAAAMLLDAHIWSNDPDFFGVGVAVWWRDTIHIAIREAAIA